jgi:hypothetical protein
LKSPDSAKENEGNPSFFAWNYLDLLGFIWRRGGARRPSKLARTGSVNNRARLTFA